MPLTLEIVTPEARVYSDTVDTVVIPTVEGEIGILPGHIPLLTQVDLGELRVMKDGKEHLLAVGGGFVQIEGDRVSVLAEHASRAETIDESVVEKAIERAQEALKAKDTLEPSEVDRIEGALRFSIVQLGIKKKRN